MLLRRTVTSRIRAAVRSVTSASSAPPPPGTVPQMLAGHTVLELAGVLAGPTVGQFLAELGANVIKVENTTTLGDVTRTWKVSSEPGGGDVATDRPSSYFSSCNLGKRSLAVDLRNDEGNDGRLDVVRVVRLRQLLLVDPSLLGALFPLALLLGCVYHHRIELWLRRGIAADETEQ